VFSMTAIRVTVKSDSVTIAEAIVVYEWIRADIRAMCVVSERGNIVGQCG
jgi:hypothetical protein